MLIENFVDSLLPLDRVQAIKHVTHGSNQVFTFTTFDLDLTIWKLSF